MCGNSSTVEYSLAKARVEGSNPFFRFMYNMYIPHLKKVCVLFNQTKPYTHAICVLVAQWIERRTTDPEVESSTLSEHVMKGL